ncbi:hypothetical protein ACLBKU_04795 [Erythrobacter sp. NE805]|uniref:hypothetical protein n=1 Tax=Erythrobacter sp. NE805 TaxID=3389875 RepID=UPI00396B2956
MTRVPVLTRTAFGAAALALAAALPAAAQQQGEVEAKVDAAATPTKGETKLAKLLEGRVAGAPVSCIRNNLRDPVRTIDGTAYVYGSGQTIYVQRTRDPQSIDTNDTLVSTRFSGSQLCRLDTITTIDRVTGMFSGAVFFEDFIPYTRVKGTAKEG